MRTSFSIALLFLLLMACSKKEGQSQSVYALVPEDAAVVFQYNDHENFLKDMEDHGIMAHLHRLNAAKLVRKKLAPLKLIKNKSRGLLMLSAETAQQFDFAYVSMDSILDMPLDSLKNVTVETVKENGKEMQRVQVDSTLFYVSTIGGYHLLSSSPSLMEKMEATYDQGGVERILRFSKAMDASKAGHLLVHSTYADNLAQLFFQGPFHHPLSQFSNWWSMDLSLDNDALSLNGISVPSDSVGTYLNLFQGSKTENQLPTYMPKETRKFKAYGVGNLHQFIKNQKLLPAEDPMLTDSIFNTTETVGTSQTPDGTILYLNTFGATGILDFLRLHQTNTDDYQSSEMLELDQATGLTALFNPFMDAFVPRFASVLENTVVFTENEAAMKMALLAHKNGDTFEASGLWQNSMDLTTEVATLTQVANEGGFQDFLQQESNDALSQEFKSLGLSDHLFGAQLIAEDGYFHTHYFVRKQKSAAENKGIQKLFSVSLDTELARAPLFVVNHRTGKMELVVQDRDHVLYLISTSGNILWQKQLSGPIQGKIHQVDLYKNNKLQLAFTTDSQFLILDRNGKPVAPFTLDYEGGNLNGLAVFDYDGNKDYRFVVTQNDKVSMYNNKAQVVKGFTYDKAEAPILSPPQHFRMGTRDYLIFQLKNNKLKILNRTGKERVKVQEEIVFSQNQVYLHKNKFTTTTTDGRLVTIGADGAVQKTAMNLHKEHGMEATSKTLAIMDDNVLRIRDKKTSLDLGVYSTPQIFYLNDKIYVSVTDIQNQRTFLFDSQAQPVGNFPINGMSSIDMADMDNDKKPELVVQDQDNVLSVYKLN